MKKSILRLLSAIAGLTTIVGCWLARQVLENIAGSVFKSAVDRTGDIGWGSLFLVLGVGLAGIGPVVMVRENHRRLIAEKKRRYGVLEFAIIVIGGIVFTLAGIATLLGFW